MEMKTPNLHNAEFLRSAVKESDFPHDPLPQIVFAGKSNVGKSSVINKLLNRKNFARVSAQPGKTIHINYFTIDKAMYLVDLPGYGYARVSEAEQPWVIIANKLDKIKKSQLEGNIAEIRQTLLLPEEVPVIPFSAEKGFGRDEVLDLIFEHVCGKEEA